jgi:aminoglycoside 3-N-acetyltransferase
MIKTDRKKLLNLFDEIGILKGSTVMAHTALFTLGMIEGGVAGFYQALMDQIGPEGTLIVPTFTYSFRRDELYDKNNTPVAKNIGIFSEFVRKLPIAVRSEDPLFSMSSVGPRASELMKLRSKNCFGIESIYSKLFDEDISFLAIGITYSTGLTGFIHLEKISSVPYRKDQNFTGKSVDDNGKIFDDYANHFITNDEDNAEIKINRETIGSLLEEKGISKTVKYGQGLHIMLKGINWRDFVCDQLKKDPYCMVDFKKLHSK